MTHPKTTDAIILAQTPEGKPEARHFEQISIAVPQLQAGQVLLDTSVVSLDPYIGLKIAGRHMSGQIKVGDVVTGEAIATVLASESAEFAPGDTVRADTGWQKITVRDASVVTLTNPAIAPSSLALGLLGMPGLTGYAGLMRIGQPVAGETVLVSAATGGVGSMVGQLARIKGCRTIGFAGSAAKCAWAVTEAGYDVCLNYRDEDCEAQLKEAAPDGVHIYYDNVGGDLLQMALRNLALNSRIILCGLMSGYGAAPVSHNMNVGQLFMGRTRVQPVIVYDHEDLRPEMERECMGWLNEGKMRFQEDKTDGLENAPVAFERLMRGENFGKVVVEI